MFERAKLDEALASMQAQINEFAANAHPTPSKSDLTSAKKHDLTAAKSDQSP